MYEVGKSHRGSASPGRAKSAVFHGVALSRGSECRQSWRRGSVRALLWGCRLNGTLTLNSQQEKQGRLKLRQ